MKKSQTKLKDKRAWQKTVVDISGIGRTTERIVEIIVKDTGKPFPIRRDLVEVYGNRAFIPMWLAHKINRRDGSALCLDCQK